MAPVKVEDDPVIAEYDVFLTPPIQEQVYLLQYPNRPRNRPYSDQYNAVPQEMRIKPRSGYMEVDIKLDPNSNFNRYMGLKWGDATRASKELHNNSGTYGPAAGLTGARPKLQNEKRALKDRGDRELELENDLASFDKAVQQEKVMNKQILGGQITNHDAEMEQGKPTYFVGAFQGEQLHLTKIAGTVQMRPNFHYLDAEEERARVLVSRAQAESAGAAPEPAARTLAKKEIEIAEKQTTEYKLKEKLAEAAKELWIQMVYVDENTDDAFAKFNSKLKVGDVCNLPMLRSQMDNDEFLDAISGPRHDSPTRKRRRPSKRKETVEIGDDNAEDGHAVGN